MRDPALNFGVTGHADNIAQLVVTVEGLFSLHKAFDVYLARC